MKKKPNGAVKIEKGVPIPVSRKTGWAAVLGDMKVGDSFAVADDQPTRNTIYQTARRLKLPITLRGLDGGQIRVWRIEAARNHD